PALPVTGVQAQTGPGAESRARGSGRRSLPPAPHASWAPDAVEQARPSRGVPGLGARPRVEPGTAAFWPAPSWHRKPASSGSGSYGAPRPVDAPRPVNARPREPDGAARLADAPRAPPRGQPQWDDAARLVEVLPAPARQPGTVRV